MYEKIEESETDSLKKRCFYYYLLKDFKLDAKFALETSIPEQFCQLISGFYALDHLQFEVSLHLKERMLIGGSGSVFFVSAGCPWIY